MLNLLFLLALLLLAINMAILAFSLHKTRKTFNSLLSLINDRVDLWSKESLDHTEQIASLRQQLASLRQADTAVVNKRINKLIYRVNQLEFRIEALEILTRRHEEALSQTLVEDKPEYTKATK